MDNGLQNKLTSFEETPPAGVWDKIAEALDSEEDFANRLYYYSQSPPQSAWNSIEKNLDNELAPAKVISFTTRFKKPIRYLAAASIIGVIAIAGNLLLKHTEAGALQAGSGVTVPLKTKNIIPLPKQDAILQNNIAPAPVNTAKETNVEKITLKRKLLNVIQPQALFASVAVAGKFIPGKVIKEALFNNKSIDNYMVFSDGNGMAMRMPKKLFPLVQCQDGDGSCQERIKSLQQKISSTSLAADFGGVLEMLHQVQ